MIELDGARNHLRQQRLETTPFGEEFHLCGVFNVFLRRNTFMRMSAKGAKVFYLWRFTGVLYCEGNANEV